MKKENQEKKNKIAKIIGIIIGIIIVLGISYALFTVVLTGKKKTKITTGTLDLELVETDEDNPEKYTHIEVTNALPVTNEEGLKTTPYVFTLKNKGNIDANYVISLEVSDTSTLPARCVKYAIVRTSQSGEFESTPMLLSNVNHYSSKSEDDQDVTMYDLDEGTIKVGKNIDFELYLWIDYDAQLVDAADKILTAKVRVSGTQILE